jgi:hypothetical protein
MDHLCIFGVGDFAGSYLGKALFLILLAFLLHLSNKPEFAVFGVRLQKIWVFWLS